MTMFFTTEPKEYLYSQVGGSNKGVLYRHHEKPPISVQYEGWMKPFIWERTDGKRWWLKKWDFFLSIAVTVSNSPMNQL